MKTAFLYKEHTIGKTAAFAAGILVFIILTSLAGFVRIPVPFSPVPVTLQTAVVLLAGACLGGRFGAGAQSGYLLLGLCGLPVFSAAGSGWLYLLGPTGGYMLSFIPAAALAGSIVRRHRMGVAGIFLVFCLVDLTVILSCGTIWLKTVTGISWSQSIAAGFVPFVVGDVVKAWLAALVYVSIRKRVS